MLIYDVNGEPRYFGVYEGLVVDNVDPQKRGRVKIRIPGLCEPSTNWAASAGGSHSSGEPGRGGFDPPKKNAAVYVQFLRGDIDHPVYFGGWRGFAGGNPDSPTAVQAASTADAANKLKVYETDAFEVVIDERGAHPQLYFKRKSDNLAVRIRDRGVDHPIQVGSNSSAEAFVLGTSYRRAQNERDNKDLAALSSLVAASQGPLAAFQPGFNALMANIQVFQSAGSLTDFLSKTGFTEY